MSVYSLHMSVYSLHMLVYSSHMLVYSLHMSVHMSVYHLHMSVYSGGREREGERGGRGKGDGGQCCRAYTPQTLRLINWVKRSHCVHTNIYKSQKSFLNENECM